MSLLENDFKKGTDWFKSFEVWIDLGYLGFEKKYKTKAIYLPQKKPTKSKNNPDPVLSDEQKIKNREISKVRIIVEHAIRGMKRYNILVHQLRAKCEKFIDRVIGVCAGLWNYKVSFHNN